MSQESKAGLDVRLLGGFSARSSKGEIALPSRPAQSLFAFLMLNAGTDFRREKLAGMLWPDSTEESARDYLRHALWRIRKSLQEAAASCLRADDLTIGIDAASDFRLDAATVREASQAKDTEALTAALSAYGGELLPGFYDEWVVLEREHLQAIFEREMERLLNLLQEAGRWPEVVEWGERWIALGQRPEPAYRALMLAHAAHGDMSKAASSYERCVKTLKDFGFEPSEQTRRLYEDIKSGKAAPQISKAGPSAPQEPQPVPASSIPVPLTSFIGRERELTRIADLLAGARLLTLTGPGGVGKTRLAIETARAAAKGFRDGVIWVSLAALSDESLIPQEIAQTLHVRELAPEPLLTTLIRHLHSKEILLVLDNCEHLIRACAHYAEQLLAACPELRLLATSIEGLGLFSEVIYQVPSLPLPPGIGALQLDEVRGNESVRLFDERAGNANAAFTLSEQNAADVVQICKRLDGIPLAIELAAARIRVLSAHEIAARLDDRFSLLTAGSRTAIPRHQTLRATIDWSHDLLSEGERVLLRRLSVFAGGFTLAGAEFVCSAGMAPGEVLDLLGRLAAKSLVVVEAPGDGETRYRLLETIRQYAVERLLSASEAEETRQRHVDFYLRMTEEAEASLFAPDSATWFRKLDREFDNVRSAIEWATISGHADLAQRMLSALVYYWFGRGLPASDWSDRIQQTLARAEGQGTTLARAKALNGIGFMYWADFDPLDKHLAAEEALAIGTELNEPTVIATALRNLGLLQCIQGNFLEARTHLQESLEIWRAVGASGQLGMAHTLVFLGDAVLSQGDLDTARLQYEEAVGTYSRLGDINFRAYAVRRLGHLAWRSGDLVNGLEYCKQSLALNRLVMDPRGLCACLAGFMAIAVAGEEFKKAAVLAGAAEAQLAAFGIRLLFVDSMEYDRNLARLRLELDAGTLEKLWAKGKAMSFEETVALALERAG